MPANPGVKESMTVGASTSSSAEEIPMAIVSSPIVWEHLNAPNLETLVVVCVEKDREDCLANNLKRRCMQIDMNSCRKLT